MTSTWKSTLRNAARDDRLSFKDVEDLHRKQVETLEKEVSAKLAEHFRRHGKNHRRKDP